MVLPKEGARKIGWTKAVCTSPDVCKTPIGSSTPSIPYQIVEYFDHSKATTPTVRFAGDEVFTTASFGEHVHGDAPGSATGDVSGTVEAKTEYLGFSATVKAEGEYIMRHLDDVHMNCKNTCGKIYNSKNTNDYSKRYLQSYQVAQNAYGTMTDANTSQGTTHLPESTKNLAKRLGILSSAALAGWETGEMIGQLFVGQENVLARAVSDQMTQNTRVFSPMGHAIGTYTGSPSFGRDAHLAYTNKLLSLKAGHVVDMTSLTPGELDELMGTDWPKPEQILAAAKQGTPTPENVRISRVLAATLGACAALACQPPVSSYRGGAHGCTKLPYGDGKDSHHMPAKSKTHLIPDMGPAIQMDPTDHADTASYKGRVNGAAYQIQRDLLTKGQFMKAFYMDVLDAKRIAASVGNPAKYDVAIAQATAYAECLRLHGIVK